VSALTSHAGEESLVAIIIVDLGISLIGSRPLTYLAPPWSPTPSTGSRRPGLVRDLTHLVPPVHLTMHHLPSPLTPYPRVETLS
jgi:hypothetical protein